MGRGPALTDAEILRIKKLRGKNWTMTRIAEDLKQSRCVVSTYLSNPEAYEKPKPPPRYKTSAYDWQRIIRLARSGRYTCQEIWKMSNTKIGLWQIQRIVGEDDLTKWRKLKHTPVLKKKHKEDCHKFAKKWIQRGAIWNQVFFSNKKKFNLDGPNSFKYY